MICWPLLHHNGSFITACCDTFALYQKKCSSCDLDIAFDHILILIRYRLIVQSSSKLPESVLKKVGSVHPLSKDIDGNEDKRRWNTGGSEEEVGGKEEEEEQQGRSEIFGCLPCYCNAAKSPLGPESCSSS